jgi:prepilin-type N-terminal cleavage/methylation domain-containing protein
MNKLNTKKGFTIIEVVLVLAIAGLIFLMVFIALPALQRNQRDTQRKNDLSRIQSAVNSYQANHKGKIPGSSELNTLRDSYLKVGGDSFQDPTGRDYTLVYSASATGLSNATWSESGNVSIQYVVGAKCDGQDVVAAGGTNKVALRMALEGGGQYCLNN